MYSSRRAGASLSVAVIAVTAVAIAGCAPADTDADSMADSMEDSMESAAQSSLPKPSYNAQGEIERPDDRYRQWVYVGTPLTPNSLNPPEAPFPDFHVVYIHPDDFAHYQSTGEFRDGTMIVKELVSVGAESATSGNGFFMGEYTGLEITTKDATRFPDEPNNWAYFTFGHSYPLAETAAAQPTPNCAACHVASAAEDMVFTQYYPVLSAAKAKVAGMGGGGR